jgi:hypothetical protein
MRAVRPSTSPAGGESQAELAVPAAGGPVAEGRPVTRPPAAPAARFRALAGEARTCGCGEDPRGSGAGPGGSAAAAEAGKRLGTSARPSPPRAASPDAAPAAGAGRRQACGARAEEAGETAAPTRCRLAACGAAAPRLPTEPAEAAALPAEAPKDCPKERSRAAARMAPASSSEELSTSSALAPLAEPAGRASCACGCGRTPACWRRASTEPASVAGGATTAKASRERRASSRPPRSAASRWPAATSANGPPGACSSVLSWRPMSPYWMTFNSPRFVPGASSSTPRTRRPPYSSSCTFVGSSGPPWTDSSQASQSTKVRSCSMRRPSALTVEMDLAAANISSRPCNVSRCPEPLYFCSHTARAARNCPCRVAPRGLLICDTYAETAPCFAS